MAAEETITIDPRKAVATMARINAQMPKELKRAFNKNLTKSARDLMKDQRSEVQAIQTSGSAGSGGMQRFTAAWAKASNARNGGVFTTRQYDKFLKSSGLRAHTAASLRVINKPRANGHELSIKAEGSRMPTGQTKLPYYMNRGKWGHPVYNKGGWANQTVTPLWFDKPAKAHEPAIAKAVEAAITEAINSLPS